MIEIKFRGKRTDTGEWIYGALVHLPGYETSICDYNSVTYSRYDVDPETVGQYIGMRDKNNTEIYNGDIISAYNRYAGKNINTVVEFESPCDLDLEQDRGMVAGWHIPDECEIIGNVCDNPELIYQLT